jgi:hypothetical protein
VNPGAIVVVGDVADRTVGVVVRRIETDFALVMVWIPARGRWWAPEKRPLSELAAAPDEWPATRNAKAAIRRNYGLIAHGGSRIEWVRVWPNGKDPYAI